MALKGKYTLLSSSVTTAIVSEAGSASGGISSHDGSKNDTDSDYIMEPSIISAISSSFNRKKL